MTNKTLEQKTEKIDWKEWIPVYGIYQNIRNDSENKPTATEGEYSFPHSVYQAVSTIAVGMGLYILAERLV